MLGGDLTPFFVNRGAHTRLPLSSPCADPAVGESPTHYAQRMLAMEVTVWELLAAAQAERKAKFDAGRVDMVFKVGDLVLLTKELLDKADIGKLHPRWDSPFPVTACQPPAGARRPALPGAVAGPHVGGRQVAAALACGWRSWYTARRR